MALWECGNPAGISTFLWADAVSVLQDIESDTGYDTLQRTPDGVLARVSQTAVYETC